MDTDSDAINEALEPFFADSLIREVLCLVKTGKEAALYCCQGDTKLDNRLAAVKVYKPRLGRAFRNDSAYQDGRVILNRHDARAVAKRTSFGREVQSTRWTQHEFEILRVLHSAGADVPKPIKCSSSAVLMEWIGDADDDPAPQLREVELQPDEAQPLFERLLANVELWLACNVVHADLSPYNLLYQPERLVAIDFPQAIDPRFNSQPYELLARDVDHVCHFFARYGVESDAGAITADLWDRFTRGVL